MEKIKKFQISTIVLTACLAVSLFFNVYPLFSGSNTNAKTFVYEWPYGTMVVYGQQYIMNGTLRLEITFKWVEDYLSIVAKINDDDRHGFDMLGLVFDINGNGAIDLGSVDNPYMLYSSNTTIQHAVYLYKDGWIHSISLEIPGPSTLHTCVFTEEGYTFDVKIPKSGLSEVAANLVYVYYQDWNIQPQPGWWVAVTFEGWQ